MDEELDALALEYRQSTSPQRRSEIRAMFWKTEQLFAYRTILLRRIQASGIPETEHARGQGMLDEKVFRETGFNKIVDGWKPEAGRAFRNYFRCAIVLRCGDVIRKLRTSQNPPGGTTDDQASASCHGGAGLLKELKALDDSLQRERGVWDIPVEETEPLIRHESPDAAAFSRPGSPLSEALADLEQEKGRGNADLGREARAVFELIHRAYIDVDNMGDFTLAEAAGPLGRDAHKTLMEAYQDDQALLTRLENSLAAALAAAQRYNCRKQRLEVVLLGTGYPLSVIRSLDTTMRQDAPGEGHRGTDSQDDIGENTPAVAERYTALCAKARSLGRRRQVLREAYEKYASVAANSPWTRSESEVARLMQMPQPNVHRRLEFARTFLREWVNRE